MTCVDMRKLVSEFDPMGATNAERHAVARHVAQCGSCTKWVDDRFPTASGVSRDPEIPDMFGGMDPAAVVTGLVRGLLPAERVKVFQAFCVHCGSADPKCQCANDE